MEEYREKQNIEKEDREAKSRSKIPSCLISIISILSILSIIPIPIPIPIPIRVRIQQLW